MLGYNADDILGELKVVLTNPEALYSSFRGDRYTADLKRLTQNERVIYDLKSILLDVERGDVADAKDRLETVTATLQHAELSTGIAFDDLTDWRAIADRPIDWVFDNVLPRRACGCITGPGAVGKSMAALTLTISAITGKTLFPAFTPSRPMRVIALFGEDPVEQVAKRLLAIGAVHEDKVLRDELDSAIVDRLGLLCAQAEPLTQLRNNVVVPTAFYQRLSHEARTADLIIIDPLSKFHGLPSENDNALVSQFMNLLQGWANVNGAAVLFCHHFSKEAVRDRTSHLQVAPRGASAFIDESRWVATLQTFDDKTAASFNIDLEEAWRYVQLRVPKQNYSEHRFSRKPKPP